MTDTPEFKPNVFQKILPPFWLFAAMALMGLAHSLYPTPIEHLVTARAIGWTVFAGAVLMAWRAKRRFDVAGTPVRPFTESTTVVEAGLFRYSRNPMYLAMIIGLSGFAIAIGDWLPFLTVPVFILIIQTQFIVHEERVMEARFGANYLDYKSRVRRWL